MTGKCDFVDPDEDRGAWWFTDLHGDGHGLNACIWPVIYESGKIAFDYGWYDPDDGDYYHEFERVGCGFKSFEEAKLHAEKWIASENGRKTLFLEK